VIRGNPGISPARLEVRFRDLVVGIIEVLQIIAGSIGEVIMNKGIAVTTLTLFLLGILSEVARPAAPPAQTATASSHKLERGGQVSIRGFAGKVIIRGWDQETVQAVGTKDGQTVPVRIVTESPSRLSIEPSSGSSRAEDFNLEVTIPREAGLESVETRGDIEVHDIQGSVRLNTTTGNIKASKTGPLNAATSSGEVEVRDTTHKVILASSSGNILVEGAGSVEAKCNSGDIVVSGIGGAVSAKTNSGNITAKDVQSDFLAKSLSGGITAEGVKGLVNASNTSQEITVRNAGSDVHAVSISGDIRLECVKGRAEGNTVSGSVLLEGNSGDIDATTTSGDVTFQGRIRPGGRYRLKSFSGAARMELAEPVPGFTATLSAYNGEIETDFALRVETPEQQGRINRRIVGRYENGQAQITLDSFSGSIQLKKGSKDKAAKCN
jgi:DUF4097 and DUF4098 domain-containing protein YvlB